MNRRELLREAGVVTAAASLVAASPTHAQAPASAGSAQALATIIGGVGASLISLASKYGGDGPPSSPGATGTGVSVVPSGGYTTEEARNMAAFVS